MNPRHPSSAGLQGGSELAGSRQPRSRGPDAFHDEPCYVISIAARMVGMHAQTLRYYERMGLVSPARSKGNIRLYRPSDIDRLYLIQRLISERGVNLAGVEAILHMQARIDLLEGEVERLDRELDSFRSEPEEGSPGGKLES
jgi:MerR family transcriptional regulator/heat shock protein HspR